MVVEDLPIPVPEPRELIIRTQACAVNRLDLLQVKGGLPPPGVTSILGVECVGTVVSRHADCELDFAEGDQVIALVSGGAYAEFVNADERTVFRTLPGLSTAALAAVPEAFMTAYQLLFDVANVKPGQSVLIHAAASSVGQALIQMCVRNGVICYGTSRTLGKCVLCKSLGAADCFLLPAAAAKFAESVKAANNGAPMDHVLCPIGSAYFQENCKSLCMDGHYTLYGTMGGPGGPTDDWMPTLLAKRITLHSTTLRSRSATYKASLAKSLRDDTVCGFASSGEWVVNVHSVRPLEKVQEAHAEMASSSNAGKIVMTVTHVADSVEFLRRELEGVLGRYK